jgi:taurine dioxygenase
MVTPRIIPKHSRGTLYIDMEAVYRRMPQRLRQFVDTHDAIHEGKWRYKVQASDVDRAIVDILAECESVAPPVAHPAAIDHPVRNDRAVYVSSGFTTGFSNVTHEESQRWLSEIVAFIERDEHVVQKSWAAGEILLWDNRCLIHKAAHADVDEPNLSFRIGIYDNHPFYRRRALASEEGRRAAAS